jgi:hypothetical protein
VRKPTSYAAEHEPPGQDEPQPADERWLKSFPIRAELAVPHEFDRAAFPWHSSQRLLDEQSADGR